MTNKDLEVKHKKRSGHTLTMLWVWIGLIPLSLLLQGLLDLLPSDLPAHGLVLPQGILVTFAGLGTFSYLGIEYASQIFQNTKLPAGKGEVTSLKLYKTLAYTWLAYYLLAVVIAMFVKIVPPFPLTELATFSGTVMLAYVAGQKGSKLSVNMGPGSADFTGSGVQGQGVVSQGGLNPIWNQQPQAAVPQAPAPPTTQPQTSGVPIQGK